MNFKITVVLCLLAVVGCSTVHPRSALREPVIESFIPISKYVFVVIPPAEEMSASVGATTKYLKPDDAISGVLLKKGLTRLTNIPEHNKEKTVLVTWGVSGSRHIGFEGAYSQEVTILIRQLDNLDTVYTCSAEGLGATEVDDIRDAIFSCLSGL